MGNRPNHTLRDSLLGKVLDVLQAIVKEMRQTLLDFRIRTSDPWLQYTCQTGDHADLKALI